ncbi:tetratricopeptide repeat protein [Thalassotalea sp. PLHSN55]|uniref:tetratricopeptide repeat protein n=1 Tax=Thalassotalea sp. PLHSN55 TaxID=3435888 RepID=UPI003F83B4DE
MSLSSSSFFLSRALTIKLDNNQATSAELDLATELKLPSAYQYHVNQLSYGSELWQKYSQLLANTQGEQAYLLANYFSEQQHLERAQFWYRHAINLNYQPAYFALAKLHFTEKRFEQAKQLLDKINHNKETDSLRIQTALHLGQLASLAQLLKPIEQTDHLPMLKQLADYGVFELLIQRGLFDAKHQPHQLLANKTNSASTQCHNSVQFYATNLADLQRLEQLLSKFSKHQLSTYFCFETPRYVPLPELNCKKRAGQSKTLAIECDESYWQRWADNIDSRYIGIMLPEGGANVHFGIMYIDQQDNELVLAHELSHWLGFIDEYPLSAQHQACASIQTEPFANNIVVLDSFYQGRRADARRLILTKLPWAEQIKSSTPILTAHKTGWQLGTPETHENENEIGVFNADSCSLSKTFAYKPTKGRTFMQSFETPFPSSYQRLLDHLNGRFAMPSFEYNIALAKFKLGDKGQAVKWLNRASMKEIDKSRQERVKIGGF